MTDKNRPKDRRLHHRRVVKGKVELGFGAAGRGSLKDISLSGVACTSPEAFGEMTILDIKMLLPTSQGDLDFQAGGAVVRSELCEAGDYLVAIFFTHMDDTSRTHLEQFLNEQADDPADENAG
jgi:hypothetical protein